MATLIIRIGIWGLYFCRVEWDEPCTFPNPALSMHSKPNPNSCCPTPPWHFDATLHARARTHTHTNTHTHTDTHTRTRKPTAKITTHTHRHTKETQNTAPPGLPYSCRLRKLVGCRQGLGTPAIRNEEVQGFYKGLYTIFEFIRVLKRLSALNRGSVKGARDRNE